MTAREPHILDAYTAQCREYKAKVRKVLGAEPCALAPHPFSEWEIEFLGKMLLRHTYTQKMMAKIDQIYETKM